jgi:hypothetical protein
VLGIQTLVHTRVGNALSTEPSPRAQKELSLSVSLSLLISLSLSLSLSPPPPFKILIKCTHGCFAYMYACAMPTHRGQKASYVLELVLLQSFVSCYVGVGNRTQVF